MTAPKQPTPENPGNQDPAEGSRRVIERELERQGGKGGEKPDDKSDSDADERPQKPPA